MIAGTRPNINLATHRGEIKLTRRGITYVFRGKTVRERRVIEEQRKKKWKQVAVWEAGRVALLPRMRNDHQAGARYTKVYAAKVDLLNKLDRLDELGVGLTVITRCAMCGRTLDDPVSVRRGVGPTCWEKR